MGITYTLIKRPLVVAGLGVFATACTAIDPTEYGSAATQPASGLRGQSSVAAPAGPAAAQGPAGEKRE